MKIRVDLSTVRRVQGVLKRAGLAELYELLELDVNTALALRRDGDAYRMTGAQLAASAGAVRSTLIRLDCGEEV